MKILSGFLLVVYLSVSASALSESLDLGDYILDIEYDDSDVVADETFRVTVTVTNEAGEFREGIVIEIDPDNVFDVVGDEDKSIGSLAADESKTVSFRLEVDSDASESDYDVDFSISDSSGFDDSDDIVVSVENNDPEIVISQRSSVPSLITAGTDDVRLVLSIENTGDGDARFLKGTLELPSGMSTSGSFGSIANIGSLDSGESEDVTFFVDVDKSVLEGNLVASMFFTYDNGDGNARSSRVNFDIPVRSSALFSIVSSRMSPVSVSPGSAGRLFIRATNIGGQEGEETTIRVFEHSDLPFEFSQKTGLIGDLSPGMSGEAFFDFEVDSDAVVKTYLLRIQTRTVSDGVVLTEDFTVPVKVSEPEEKSFVWVYFVVALVLLMVLTFLVARR